MRKELEKAISDIEIFTLGRSNILCGRTEWNLEKINRYEEYIEEAKNVILNLAKG